MVKAQQRLYFVRTLRKANLSTKLLLLFTDTVLQYDMLQLY